MKPKSSNTKLPAKSPAERVVKDIRRQTRRHFSAEDKIRIVLEGLRGDDSIAELCRKEGIAQSLYYTWSKEFMEAGKRRLAGDTARAATTDEVKGLRREARDLKECLALQLADRDRLDPAMAALLDNLDRLAKHDYDALQSICGVDADEHALII